MSGFKVVTERRKETGAMGTRIGYVLQEGEGLSKTTDGEIVLSSDPKAAFIYRGPGQKISPSQAEELGFVAKGKGKKVAEAQAEEDNSDSGKDSGDSGDSKDSGESSDAPAVEVPDGVVPGETPGWPLDAETGEPLNLNDDQRSALAENDISGEIDVDDVDDLVEGIVGSDSGKESGESKSESKSTSKKASSSTKKRSSSKKTSAKKPSKRSTKKRS